VRATNHRSIFCYCFIFVMQSGAQRDPWESKASSYGELNRHHYTAMGGSTDGVKLVTTAFYNKVFNDPLLSVMFADNSEVHAERLAWLLLYFMGVSQIYFQKRGSFSTVHAVHRASKQRIERESGPPGCGHKGGDFTRSQVCSLNYAKLFDYVN